MKAKRFRIEKETNRQGWTRWVQPYMPQYLMACCDCGLVHEMRFRIVNGRVQFRARRAPRYTARERARRKYGS